MYTETHYGTVFRRALSLFVLFVLVTAYQSVVLVTERQMDSLIGTEKEKSKLPTLYLLK